MIGVVTTPPMVPSDVMVIVEPLSSSRVAVPFFAAYFALMSAQTNARMADAAQMYKGHYNEFMDRARKQSNPNVNNWIYRQSGDPAQSAKFGISKGGAA